MRLHGYTRVMSQAMTRLNGAIRRLAVAVLQMNYLRRFG